MKLNEVQNLGLYYDIDDIYFTPENIYEVKNEDNKNVIYKWHYDYSDDENNDYYTFDKSFIQTDEIIDNKYNVDVLDLLSQSYKNNNLIIQLKNS